MKKQSGFISIVAVILVLVIAGGLAYWYYQSQHTTTTVSSDTKATPASETKVVDPYTGWKTYVSGQEGLSFKYPSSWTLASLGHPEGTVDWISLSSTPKTRDIDSGYVPGEAVGSHKQKAAANYNIIFHIGVPTAAVGSTCGLCKVLGETNITVSGQKIAVIDGGDIYTGSWLYVIPDPKGQNLLHSFASKLGGKNEVVINGEFLLNNSSVFLSRADFDKDDDVKTAVLILKSLTY